MSTTQFAMVEELASLVKDNYPSRHLVLAVEEALINFLESDPSPDGILELEPMSSYNRLILHRLADIFGFSHESVGEGDDRHLVLQQCVETSIPSILVSDILWQNDRCESSPLPYQLLRRDDTSSVLKMNIPHSTNLIDREAAYLAARERIFGVDEVELKDSARQKPRTDPIVARRMISHALGQRTSHSKADNTSHPNEQSNVHTIERRFTVNFNLTSETSLRSGDSRDKNVTSLRAGHSDTNCSRPGKPNEKLTGKSVAPCGRDGLVIPKKSMKEENFGAAKRMFAHALGRQTSKDDVSRSRVVKGVSE